MLSRLLTSLLLVAIAATSVAASSLTIYVWPLSASSPSPYLEIDLPSSPSAASPEIRKRHKVAVPDNEFVRVGLLDSDKAWRGVATSGESFGSGVSQKISLHSDGDGRVKHVGFSAYMAKASAGKEEVLVDMVTIQDGAQPVLNKPVVLNPEGKIDKPAAEDNRSFLQKYWWAIALFLVLQVVGGGGGKD